MKKTLLIALLFILASCKSGLEKRYDKSSLAEDLIDVSEQISAPELELLKNYISESEAENKDLSRYRYQILLSIAKRNKIKQEQKIAYEKREEKARIEREKIINQKTELLCANKWKITEFAFQMKIPDDSQESIDLAKDLLNKAFRIKDCKLITSVVKESGATLVRGAFDDETVKIFYNSKWEKRYFKDGTYKEGSTQGTWEFVNPDQILERRPIADNFSRIKTNTFYIDIKHLDKNTFHFYEKQYDYRFPDSTISNSIIMEAK
jgi:hypothetical protein